MAPTRRTSESRIPLVQKNKTRAETIKAAREKYSELSRRGLPPPTTTVPLDRPSRIPPPSASLLPRPGEVFRADPTSAAVIRDGPQATARVTGRPSMAPRPSLAPRVSMAPRPSIAPRPSMMPRGAFPPFSGLPFGSNFSLSAANSSLGGPSSSTSSTVPFEPVGESLTRIMRNEPLPMASGARASSIARRHTVRPSLAPGGINIFTATGAERLEAERLLLQGLHGTTPGRSRLNRGGDESVLRSRVRFELAESIQEQRESVGDEADEAASSSSSTAVAADPSVLQPILNQQSTLRREPLVHPVMPMERSEEPSAPVEPPRSILKKKKSPRSTATSSSSSTSISTAVATSSSSSLSFTSVVASSTSSIFANTILEASTTDENQPRRGTPSRTRATPARNASAKKTNKKKEINMMDFFAYLEGLVENDEERRNIPNAILKSCMEKMAKLVEKNEEEQKEEETEGEETEEDDVLERGIPIEAEEEEEAHETLPLPICELTIDGTPRRRSSRIASNSQGKVARSLFSNQ